MSKKQVAFRARIKDGEIIALRNNEKQKALKVLEGMDNIIIRLETVGDDVSANQRAYYFATNRYLIHNEETFGGWSEDEVDEFARELFLSKSCSKEVGTKQVIFNHKKSIREIDKDEMRSFIDNWLSYLSLEHGIYCPSVEEILMSKYSNNE